VARAKTRFANREVRSRAEERSTLLRRVAVTLAVLASVLATPLGVSPAGAWCYQVGSHASAQLNWEYNGSDAVIKWNGDHSVSAVRDKKYSIPTLNKSEVILVGSQTRLTAGARARLATLAHHTKWPTPPYGAFYNNWDGYARALSSDLRACT